MEEQWISPLPEWILDGMLGEGASGVVYQAHRYARADGFLAGYPILSYAEESGAAFNCYGWGTARNFVGGMFAVVRGELIFYAEYDAEGVLSQYYNAATDCAYGRNGDLLSGAEPEGYVNPVRVLLPAK